MQTAQGCNASLEEDIAAAQQALQRWQRTTNNEAKLAKALKEGASVAGLSRAIQVGTTKLRKVKQLHLSKKSCTLSHAAQTAHRACQAGSSSQ